MAQQQRQQRGPGREDNFLRRSPGKAQQKGKGKEKGKGGKGKEKGKGKEQEPQQFVTVKGWPLWITDYSSRLFDELQRQAREVGGDFRLQKRRDHAPVTCTVKGERCEDLLQWLVIEHQHFFSPALFDRVELPDWVDTTAWSKEPASPFDSELTDTEDSLGFQRPSPPRAQRRDAAGSVAAASGDGDVVPPWLAPKPPLKEEDQAEAAAPPKRSSPHKAQQMTSRGKGANLVGEGVPCGPVAIGLGDVVPSHARKAQQASAHSACDVVAPPVPRAAHQRPGKASNSGVAPTVVPGKRSTHEVCERTSGASDVIKQEPREKRARTLGATSKTSSSAAASSLPKALPERMQQASVPKELPGRMQQASAPRKLPERVRQAEQEAQESIAQLTEDPRGGTRPTYGNEPSRDVAPTHGVQEGATGPIHPRLARWQRETFDFHVVGLWNRHKGEIGSDFVTRLRKSGMQIPEGAIVLDCRPLADPHVNRHHCGSHASILAAIVAHKRFPRVAWQLVTLLEKSPEQRHVVFACKAGRHRSVAMAFLWKYLMRENDNTVFCTLHERVHWSGCKGCHECTDENQSKVRAIEERALERFLNEEPRCHIEM